MLKLVPLLVLLAACGSDHSGNATSSNTPNEPQADPAHYVAEYEALAKPHLGQDFTVTTQIALLDALPGVTDGGVGDCDSVGNKIEILKAKWDAWNGVERKETLFHELAHCNQYRPHLDTKLPSGLPASIMTSGLLPDWVSFQANEAYYETELFSVTETCGKGDALPCRKP